jgi:hypothetical protein
MGFTPIQALRQFLLFISDLVQTTVMTRREIRESSMFSTAAAAQPYLVPAMKAGSV